MIDQYETTHGLVRLDDPSEELLVVFLKKRVTSCQRNLLLITLELPQTLIMCFCGRFGEQPSDLLELG